MTVEIRQHAPGADTRDFIQAGFEVFRGDPAWVAPLGMMIKERLDPKKDPSHKHMDVALFTAWKNGAVVGRVSASVDHAWLDLWKDETGHFGYFDTIDDEEVARALLSRAEAWLRGKGMKRVNGPMSLSANQEIGVLVDGFEHPPVLDMGHSRSYQGALAEKCGYAKEKDLYAWRYESTGQFNVRTLKAWEAVQALPEVKLRSVNTSKLREELGVIMDYLQRDVGREVGLCPGHGRRARQDGERHVSRSRPEHRLHRGDRREAGRDVHHDSEPERGYLGHGREALPVQLGEAALADQSEPSPASSRLILLGVRQEYRKNVKRYGGLSAAMYVEVAKRGLAKGYKWAELGWTREDDAPINLGIRSMGARVYKTYRVYEKRLG